MGNTVAGANCGANSVRVRLMGEGDSLEDLTAMLHRAFARLGQSGLNCTCVDQSVAVTHARIAKGECYVAVSDGRMVGTITLYGPDPGSACTWYRRCSAASIHQLAVDPKYQENGIGTRLLQFAEAWAGEHGYRELALDTPQAAYHLVEFYRQHGYLPVGTIGLEGKRYSSVVLSKAITEESAGEAQRLRPFSGQRRQRAVSSRIRSRHATSQLQCSPRPAGIGAAIARSEYMNYPGLCQHRCRLRAADGSAGRNRGAAPRFAAAIAAVPRHVGQMRRILLHFTVDAAMAMRFRNAAASACGDTLRFLRIEPVARSDKFECGLCIASTGFELASDAIIRTMTAAHAERSN